MRLILIRHGETDWNAALRYQGQANVPLNQRGREQAKLLTARLQARGAIALYTSDLVRAQETAEIVGAGLKLKAQALPDLREIDVGQWEGLTPEELYRRFPDHMRQYERDPARTVRIGGESYQQLQERALRALKQIESKHTGDQVVVAVSHGGTIRAILCHVIGLELINFGKLWLDNGSISELHLGSNGWRVMRLNDAAHLESMGISNKAGGLDWSKGAE